MDFSMLQKGHQMTVEEKKEEENMFEHQNK